MKQTRPKQKSSPLPGANPRGWTGPGELRPQSAPALVRLESGIRNLDDLLDGGIPKGSVVVLGGPPGSGKTIFAQQFAFHNATARKKAIVFGTLSEPTAKSLCYLQQFSFFDPKKFGTAVEFVDLGSILRTKGLTESLRLIQEHVRRLKPAFVVIDSFKVFDDLASSKDELRKFGYEVVVNLMTWETTTLLLGEYSPTDLESNPLFSVVDGLILMSQRDQSGEEQRFLRVAKLRGANHDRDEHTFRISSHGIDVFAPRATILRLDGPEEEARLRTGISRLDDLLGPGIPRGSSLLIGGVAGTGKTALILEFIYRGALQGEKGILFSFEETTQRLLAAAHGMGMELRREIKRGNVKIVFIPQPDILVEQDLLMIREQVTQLGALRIGIDSVSVFLHKMRDPQLAREKIFQLATIAQNSQAVGFFSTDIPYGSKQISRFGVEETVVDGIILLSSTEEGLSRRRFLEVYKMRNTAHLEGRHNLLIGDGGLTIFPRYSPEDALSEPAPIASARLPSGVPGLDALLGGGLLERSVTLISGSAGIGKSTLGVQFIVEGTKRGEPGLIVALEEGSEQLKKSAQGLGLPLAAALKGGQAEILYLSRDRVRASQFPAILTQKIKAQKTRRLVLDSVTFLLAESELQNELRQLLYGLVSRFKELGVTSLLTLESRSLESIEGLTDHGLSPVADNLILLRYEQLTEALRPSLVVVKTRGSAHDWGRYAIEIGRGGLRVGARLETAVEPAAPSRSRAKR